MITYIQLGLCALLLLTSIILAVGLYRESNTPEK